MKSFEEMGGINGRAKSTMALSMLTNVCVKSPRILWIIVFDDVSSSLTTLARNATRATKSCIIAEYGRTMNEVRRKARRDTKDAH